MDPRMKQLWLQFLLAVFIAGAWLLLEEVQCQNTPKDHPVEIRNVSNCYNKSSGKTCFTLLTNSSKIMRRSFKAANDLCKEYVPGSSLIVIESLADQKSVEGFIGSLANETFKGKQSFADETIFTDARKLSAKRRLDWSWVKGHQTIPTEVNGSSGAGCVVLKDGKQLAYCVDNVTSEYQYICKYSDSNRFNYQQNNKYYFASNRTATWYEARSDCLGLGGDLASLTDLGNITETSWLIQSIKYWIGLYKNQWIWNSTGAAITYTNWENGYPDDSADKECICLIPKCSKISSVAICDERKWWSCDCKNNSNAVVCQTEEEREIFTPTAKLSSTSADFNSSTFFPVLTEGTSLRSSSSSSAITMTTTTIPTTIPTTKTTTKTTKRATTKTPTKTTTKTTTRATTKATTKTTLKISKSSMNLSDVQTTSFAETISPPGLFQEFAVKEILLMVLLFVVVVFVVVAVVVVLRKRKYARRNEESSLKATKEQNEPSAYVTVVPHNGPSDGTVPPSNTIYAEVEMNQRPTPSSNAIYASVQPTGEAVDTGKSVVYADLDFVQNVQKKPKSSDKIAACLGPIYANPCDAFTSDGNAVYAEPFKPDRPPTVHANIYHQ